MRKKERLEKNFEFRYYEEHFEEMMKEMQKDQEKQSFETPEEWERDFRNAIDKALREEKLKQKKQVMRKASMAAAVVFAVLIGVNRSVEVVHGKGFLEVLQQTFGYSEKNYVTLGATEETDMPVMFSEDEVIFDTTSLEEIYEQARQEIRLPMHYITYIPEGYKVEEAKYDRAYRVLNLKLVKEEETIYVSQQQVVDETATGMVEDEKASAKVENDYLGYEIPIFQGGQDKTLVFSAQNGNMLLTFRGILPLEECKKIVENIVYK